MRTNKQHADALRQRLNSLFEEAEALRNRAAGELARGQQLLEAIEAQHKSAAEALATLQKRAQRVQEIELEAVKVREQLAELEVAITAAEPKK